MYNLPFLLHRYPSSYTALHYCIVFLILFNLLYICKLFIMYLLFISFLLVHLSWLHFFILSFFLFLSSFPFSLLSTLLLFHNPSHLISSYSFSFLLTISFLSSPHLFPSSFPSLSSSSPSITSSHPFSSFLLLLFLIGTRVDLEKSDHHIPNMKTVKEMMELLDFSKLSQEELDDMKAIAKKIKASGA